MRIYRAIGAMLIAAFFLTIGEAAQAADAIKAGNWEFTMVMQVPNLPKLPPGVALPGIQIGPGGINVVHTSCVTSSQPMPADLRPPNQQHGQCKIEKIERAGGTVKWSTTCATPQGTIHSDGVAHYSGDTMEATFATHTSGGNGQPTDSSQHITGRYLGPCDAK